MSFQDRVQILDKDGNFISQFGQTGSGQLEFDAVKGISINSDVVVVADSGNNRVQVLDTAISFLQSIGGAGTGESQFLSPTDVIFNGDRLFVIDKENNRVQVFKYVGKPDVPFEPVNPIEGIKSAFAEAIRKALPSGDAFQSEPLTDSNKYHEATAEVFAEALDDFISYQNLTIPKIPTNDDFTTDDLARLENAYGLLINNSKPIEYRVETLEQRMRGASGYQGRQSAQWLQDQLFSAGFNVYVLENKFSNGSGGYETRVPRWNSGSIFMDEIELLGKESPVDEAAILGRNSLNVTSEPKIVNSIYPEEDSAFNLGNMADATNPLLKSTFFLTGGTGGAVGVRGVPDYDSDAYVPINREVEFRILVLANKPAHTVALQHIKLS